MIHRSIDKEAFIRLRSNPERIHFAPSLMPLNLFLATGPLLGNTLEAGAGSGYAQRAAALGPGTYRL